MDKVSFVIYLKAGMEVEYIRRHKNIGEEMKGFLKAAGISNYTIWLHRQMLFGYYEVNDREKAEWIKSTSPIQKAWDLYMEELFEKNEYGKVKKFLPECVFELP